MTDISTLFPAASLVKSIQSGFFAAQATAVNSALGRDGSYLDITIPAVTVSKCIIYVDGNALIGSASGWSTYQQQTLVYFGGGSSYNTYRIYARLINSTTLRISTYNYSALAYVGFVGQYQIMEFN